MRSLRVAPTGECWAAFGLRITVRESGEARAVFTLTGDLDLASAPLLTACLNAHLSARRRFLRLELGDLTFIDAAGLAAVHAAHRDVLAKRGTLVITTLSPQGQRVIRLVGLDRELLIAAQPSRPYLTLRPA